MAATVPITAPAQNLDLLCINTIRTLSMDAVQQANSGHPGTPMGMAPVAYCLWQQFLRFDPEDPIWPNRDRFVLSIGHASMLLYSLLHLCGVKAVDAEYERLGDLSVKLEDLKTFRSYRASVPAIPNIAGLQGSRPRRVRWDRASQPAWGWRWPDAGWRAISTAPDSTSSTITSTRYVVTAA